MVKSKVGLKRIIISTGFGLLLCAGIYFYLGRALWSPNVKLQNENNYILVPTNASFEDVVGLLNDQNCLIDESSFRRIATLMRYNKNKVPAGRYKIEQGWSNRTLITKLRSGDQDANQVVINGVRMISNLSGEAARYFETDSLGFLSYLSRPETALQFGFNSDNFMTMFIPNTYEMFWTTTPEKFVLRMKKEYDNYWTKEREDKLKKWNIDKTQAYIVASIVEKESNYDPEKSTIAGVYLNRLKTGEKLQADPTVVFATGEFGLKRVLYSHLEMDSPYNTYKYAGLPPGPICMPSIASLEAVINADSHDYMFFCAKADNSGIHAFAKDYAEHQKNAKAFADWMNQNNIR
ncbi:MAG: endolytic transglycosylase MltG [Saprospiraceae bacterium]|nr:endolytic transglycosylase MltG [Saprospiraceae bacterium]